MATTNQGDGLTDDKEGRVARAGMVVLAAVLTVALLAVAMLSYTGQSIVKRNAPLIEATGEIRYRTSLFHLWYEELIAGDSSLDLEEVWTPMEDAKGFVRLMLEGGVHSHLAAKAVEDPELKVAASAILDALWEFEDTARRRLERGTGERKAGGALDQQFDATFKRVLALADEAEVVLQRAITAQVERYQIMTIGLSAAIMVSILLAGWLYVRHDRERRRLLAELRASHEELELRVRERAGELRKFSQAIEQNAMMVIMTDTEGRIEYVNPAFCRTTGYAREEVIGKTPAMVNAGQTEGVVYKDMWATIRAGEDWRGELLDRRKSGETFWVSVLITPVRGDGGRVEHFIAIEEDITARKAVEADMRAARRQAEIASRAKTEMIANMSHELRTPLNAIMGFSDAMKVEMFGPLGHPKYSEYLDSIHVSATHLLALINDILDVAAIEAGQLRLSDDELSIEELAGASVRLVQPRADRGEVTLLAGLAPDLPRLRGDERRLKQVLINLLTNAVKFTDPGGEVSIDAWLTGGGEMVICVADTGIGMTPDEVETALSPFGQVDGGLARKRQEGTGLGLPLSRELVEAHGGRFEVESAKGNGTRVSLIFPAERVLAG